MARSLRSRKPLGSCPEEENVLEARTKKPNAKKAGALIEESESQPDGADVSMIGAHRETKKRTTKGNVNTDRRTAKAIRAPVLRDRTNLVSGEPLKVDLLMKQGTALGGTREASKSTRGKLKSVNMEIGGDERAMKTTGMPAVTRKKPERLALREKTSLAVDTRDIAENVGSPIDDDARTSKIDIIAKKPARSTRRTAKSADLGNNERENAKKMKFTETTRKVSRKIEANGESSSLSRGTMKNIAEIVESTKSVIPKKTVETTSVRPVERAIVRKISSTKKINEIVDCPSRGTASTRGKEANERAVSSVEKKFFKSKVAALKTIRESSPIEKTENPRRRRIIAPRNPRVSASFRCKRTKNDESLAKQETRKNLRPRKASKNYCEVSIDARPVPQNNDDDSAGKSVPVYKHVESTKDPTCDRNEIYEFQFDSDDSREKLPKKTRRKPARRNLTTKSARPTIARKAANSQTQAITKDPNADPNEKTKKMTKKNANAKLEAIEQTSLVTNEIKPEVSPRDTSNNEIPSVPMEINSSASFMNKSTKMPINARESPTSRAKSATKPIIVKSVELKGTNRISLSATPVRVKSSESKTTIPSRPSERCATTPSHALLCKSLSPITKAIESFDPGSPWRPPTFNIDQQFSRVKNIVHSTPQIKNFSALTEKSRAATMRIVNEARNDVATTQQDKKVTEITKIAIKRSPSKAIGSAKSPRKFGTVISNVNDPTGLDTRNNETNSEATRGDSRQKISSCDIETRIVKTRDSSTIVAMNNEESMNFSSDDRHDKENCLSVRSSPNKSPLKSLKYKLNRENYGTTSHKNPPRSPLKSPKKLLSIRDNARPLNNGNNEKLAEPQIAGTSGMKNLHVSGAMRVLQQSNLDNFLNLDEMPKSTRIKTIHGIFDDVHSTPINGRAVAKISKIPNIDNAFGFDEFYENEIDVSPIKGTFNDRQTCKKASTRDQRDERGKIEIAKTSRLPIADIKKHLLPIRKKEIAKEEPIVERIEEEENEENRDKMDERRVGKSEENYVPVDFTDTFDVLAQKMKTDETSMKEIPLFGDLEPPHFKQAPRYSYKRKRAVGFVPSDDEDENASLPVAETHGPKKRKISKVEKKREEQMENWAKDVNQTFEEIDHFDLVVE